MSVSENESKIREKIIVAATACIERDGMQKTTIRSIARMAQVNSAAINYYFRSKENLIQATLRATLDHFFQDLEGLLADSSLGHRQLLEAYLNYLQGGMSRYPKLVKAHLHDALYYGRYQNGFFKRFHKFLRRLAEKLPASPKGDMQETIAQLTSVIMLQELMPGLFKGFLPASLQQPKQQQAYIARLVARWDEK